MKLGLMNHPARPIADEIRAIAGAGFEFVDLTLEPPAAWPVDAGEVGRLLRELGLLAVGHTSPHLPLGVGSVDWPRSRAWCEARATTEP